MKEFVSIIIPVFNDESGIKNTIESLLDQSFPNDKYEILVIDNNSTDSTADVIKKYDRVKYFFEKKQGSYAARNRGIKESGGDILCFIDSECVAHRDWLVSGLKNFYDDDVGFVAGKIIFSFEADVPSALEYADSVLYLNQEEYVKQGFAVTANIFVRRKIFEKYGLFNDNLESGGDYEFGTRVSGDQKLTFSKEAIAFHPARRSLGELIKKAKRTGRGQKDLQKMDLLKINRLSRRSFVPKIRYIKNDLYEDFNFLKRVKVFFVINIIKYINLIERLK